MASPTTRRRTGTAWSSRSQRRQSARRDRAAGGSHRQAAIPDKTRAIDAPITERSRRTLTLVSKEEPIVHTDVGGD